MSDLERASRKYRAGLEANEDGNTRGALKCFLEAIALMPNKGAWILSAGNMAFKLDDVKQARSLYERARQCELTAQNERMVNDKLAALDKRAADRTLSSTLCQSDSERAARLYRQAKDPDLSPAAALRVSKLMDAIKNWNAIDSRAPASSSSSASVKRNLGSAHTRSSPSYRSCLPLPPRTASDRPLRNSRGVGAVCPGPEDALLPLLASREQLLGRHHCRPRGGPRRGVDRRAHRARAGRVRDVALGVLGRGARREAHPPLRRASAAAAAPARRTARGPRPPLPSRRARPGCVRMAGSPQGVPRARPAAHRGGAPEQLCMCASCAATHVQSSPAWRASTNCAIGLSNTCTSRSRAGRSSRAIASSTSRCTRSRACGPGSTSIRRRASSLARATWRRKPSRWRGAGACTPRCSATSRSLGRY